MPLHGGHGKRLPVQILDLPVPQTVDNVTDALRFLDLPVAEQLVDVPMISSSSCPSRAVPLDPQMAGRLCCLLPFSSSGLSSSSLPFLFRVAVVVIVFKVFPQDRIQQRLVEQSTLTFFLPVFTPKTEFNSAVSADR